MAIAMLAPYAAAEYLLRQHGALIGPMPGSQVRGPITFATGYSWNNR